MRAVSKVSCANATALLGASVGAVAIIVAKAAAACCSYSYSWPGGDSDCGGQTAWVCEESSGSSSPDDPLARLGNGSSRPANCYEYDVGGGHFERGPCDSPPSPNAKLVGRPSTGDCCWAVNEIGGVQVDSVPHPDNFAVRICELDCGDGGGVE